MKIRKCAVCGHAGIDESEVCPCCGWIASVVDEMFPDIHTNAGNATTLNQARVAWNFKQAKQKQ